MKCCQTFDQMHIWDAERCEQMMSSIGRILSEIGCVIHNASARDLLAENGCAVEGDRVRIPEELLRRCVQTAPSEIRLFTRDGEPAMKLGQGRSYFGPPISTVFVRDAETGERRRGTVADAGNAGLVCDALDYIGWASAMCGVQGPAEGLDDVYEVYGLLPNTAKPLMYWASSLDNLKVEFEMFEAAAGGAEALEQHPFTICLTCPQDPLVHHDDVLAQVMYLAARNAPVTYIAGATIGMATPVTIAGSVAVGLADTLVGLVVGQLVRPGSPFIAARFSDNVNFQNMNPLRARPEYMRSHIAAADFLRHFGIPFSQNLGDTDCGLFEQVAACDLATGMMVGLADGCNMIMAMGGFDSAMTADYTGLVAGNELAGDYDALFAPLSADDDELGFEDIEEVGPGGNFMLQDITLELCHDFWSPDVFRACNSESAEAAPGFDRLELMRERVRRIIAAGPTHPLGEAKMQRIDAIMAEAESRLA